MLYMLCLISRVESFIEHQDACTVRRVHPELPGFQAAACSSRTASSTSPSSETNFSMAPMQKIPGPLSTEPLSLHHTSAPTERDMQNNLELQLLPSSSSFHETSSTQLKLSIGSGSSSKEASKELGASTEKMRLAMAEKEFAEEARQQVKRQIEMAELEFGNAKRIRQQAQAELERAQLLKDQATKKISSTILEITCHACKQRFQTTTAMASAANANADETSLAVSYMSSATTEGEGL